MILFNQADNCRRYSRLKGFNRSAGGLLTQNTGQLLGCSSNFPKPYNVPVRLIDSCVCVRLLNACSCILFLIWMMLNICIFLACTLYIELELYVVPKRIWILDHIVVALDNNVSKQSANRSWNYFKPSFNGLWPKVLVSLFSERFDLFVTVMQWHWDVLCPSVPTRFECIDSSEIKL